MQTRSYVPVHHCLNISDSPGERTAPVTFESMSHRVCFRASRFVRCTGSQIENSDALEAVERCRKPGMAICMRCNAPHPHRTPRFDRPAPPRQPIKDAEVSLPPLSFSSLPRSLLPPALEHHARLHLPCPRLSRSCCSSGSSRASHHHQHHHLPTRSQRRCNTDFICRL